jgi:hypothetical protein
VEKRILVRLAVYPIAYILWGGLMWYSQIITPIDVTNLLLKLPLCNKEFYLTLQSLPAVIIEFFKIIYLYGFSFEIVGGIGYYLFIKKDFLKSDTILIDLAFFPNTRMGTYWTSMTAKDNPSLAYEIPFFYGGSIVREKSIDTYIRLVRSAD